MVKAREPRSRTKLVVDAMSMDNEGRILLWGGAAVTYLPISIVENIVPVCEPFLPKYETVARSHQQ